VVGSQFWQRLDPWVVSKGGWKVGKSTSAVGVDCLDTRLRLPVSLLVVGLRQSRGTCDPVNDLTALERKSDLVVKYACADR